MAERTYWGDGCYASFDGFAIELVTSNGVEITNRVYLEPEVFAALVEFRTRVVGAARAATVNMPLAPNTTVCAAPLTMPGAPFDLALAETELPKTS